MCESQTGTEFAGNESYQPGVAEHFFDRIGNPDHGLEEHDQVKQNLRGLPRRAATADPSPLRHSPQANQPIAASGGDKAIADVHRHDRVGVP